MKSVCFLDFLAVAVIVIGGINWGLVGLFSFDLVAFLFGDMTALTRTLYVLVGVSAVYAGIRSPARGFLHAPAATRVAGPAA